MSRITTGSLPRYRRPRVIFAMNIVVAMSGAAAVGAFVLEYGFREAIVPSGLLHAVQAAIVGVFVLDRLGRFLLARKKTFFLRENWIDFALIAIAGGAVAVSSRLHLEVLSAGTLYIIITQAYLLIALLFRAVNVNLRFAESGIHPTWLLIGSFAFLSLAGSGLLMLPVATPETESSDLYYSDALFTAVSATCVTGLITRDTGQQWTLFGQAVILVLIQLGGLGIMLFGTTLAMLLGKAISIRGSDAIGQMLSTQRVGDISRTLWFVIVFTFLIEIVGAILLYPLFASALDAAGNPFQTGRAIWYSVFHSVSSFCNAGFSLYRFNMMEGVSDAWSVPLREHWQIMGVMAPMIILGGLGFPVLQDCARWVRDAWRRFSARRGSGAVAARELARPRLSLHSRIVLVSSLALILLGAGVLLLVEPWTAASGDEARVGDHAIKRPDVTISNDWKEMSSGRKIRAAVFQSITARTAGFNTIEMKQLTTAGKLWMCVLMMIGGSPAGTAGGMKTVTFALLVLTTWAALRRRGDVEIFGRAIPVELIRRTVALAVLYLALVCTVAILLCIALPGQPFIDLLFEASSACGTVGLSTGVTRALNDFGKYVIVGGMFLGRIGPLTLLLALTSHVRVVNYRYPRENVVIG